MWQKSPSYFLITLSVILLLISLAHIGEAYMYTATTTAMVTAATCNAISGSQYRCQLTVTFTILTKTYQAAIIIPNSTTAYTLGQSVTVYYNPSNPYACRLTSARVGLGAMIFAGLSFLLLLYSLSFLFNRQKDSSRPELSLYREPNGLDLREPMSDPIAPSLKTYQPF